MRLGHVDVNVTDARRLKELESENSKQKRIVAKAFDIVILKDVNSRKW